MSKSVYAVVVLLALQLIGIISATGSSTEAHEDVIRKSWDTFKSHHNMRFGNAEESKRFNNFKENYLRTMLHNHDHDRNMSSFRAELNAFAHMSHEEFMRTRLGLRVTNASNPLQAHNNNNRNNPHLLQQDDENIPASFNWVDKGIFTSVENQGSCGACWSFSAAGVIESLYAIKNARVVRFSKQQLIDCTYNNTYDNLGCDGGYPENAFSYGKSEGLVEERNYPYRAKEGHCFDNSNSAKARFRINGYYNMPYGNEKFAKRVIAKVAPIAIGLDASAWSFAFYKTGIYDEKKCSATNLNHAVMIVGYGTENGNDYWLIKNSWGKNWGEGGYMKIIRGQNMCGVMALGTYAY